MKHISIITKKPELSGKSSTPDGAVSGNGDLCVISGNSENGFRIYIAKCDIWYGVECYNKGGMRPLGCIDIPVEESLYNNYYVEQDMDCGEIRCSFKKDAKKCEFTVKVIKTENAVVIENTGNVKITPVLKVFPGETDGRKGEFKENGISGIFRSFDGEECEYECHVYASLKEINSNLYYMFCATNFDCEKPKEAVCEKITVTDEKRVKELFVSHKKAWEELWSKSSFTLSDEELENSWYSSQYLLAICTGNKRFPPGIFGNFITVENPAWHNDYHLNYNFQAPFYAACSSNHTEFTDCYIAPLEEFLEKGRKFASKFGCRGVLYPVAVTPRGLCSELNTEMKYSFERLFLGQKSNAIHPMDIPVFRWYATRDEKYAREHAYPLLKECLLFFEDYGEWRNGRFFVARDAAHEVPIYKADYNPKKYKRYLNDTNNTLTMGLLRLCIPAAVDMAKALKVDEGKIKIWQNIYDNLSPFATYYRFGKKVYRYTYKGQMWNNGGDVGMQHIYPCGCVGLSSPEKELKIARNTFKMKAKYCFLDDNAVSSFFPMAARLGIDPHYTLGKFRELNRKKRLPNMLYKFGGGCLEDCSIPASMLNEMALQSYEGVIRIFPCWDKSVDCEFKNLRADGAFLVSSSVKNGKTERVEIFSEKGRELYVILPSDGWRVVSENGENELSGKEYITKTSVNEKLIFIKKECLRWK